jgi:hypothetical protein
MFSNDHVFEATRHLRPHLSAIVDDAALAAQTDQQLAQLLTQTDLEEDQKADRIIELLNQNPATQTWLERWLNASDLKNIKGYQPLPGDPPLLSATQYICPIANDYTWYREGNQSVPLCPTHLVPLVPAS